MGEELWPVDHNFTGERENQDHIRKQRQICLHMAESDVKYMMDLDVCVSSKIESIYLTSQKEKPTEESTGSS